MLYRNNVEKSMRRLYSNYGYGSTVWSPMALGILSGKYNDGGVPSDSRFGAKKMGPRWST